MKLSEITEIIKTTRALPVNINNMDKLTLKELQITK